MGANEKKTYLFLNGLFLWGCILREIRTMERITDSDLNVENVRKM